MEGRPKGDKRERAYVHRRNNKLPTEQEHLDRLWCDPQLHRRPRSTKIGTHHRKGPQKNESSQLREALPIVGVSKRVPLKLGAWSGEMDLVVVHMNDFDVVLGMDFLLEHKVITMPLLLTTTPQ